VTMFGNKGALAVIVLVKIFIYGATHLVAEASGKKVADIYWNTTNQIFYLDNKRHIFEVRLMDSIDIICPKYGRSFPEEMMEYSLIYLVDRRSYETCSIDSKKPKVLGMCTEPYKSKINTIVFREFTPSPTGFEYRVNTTYYVISTSDGSPSGLKNEMDGLCKNYNMRLQFVVKPRCRPKNGPGAASAAGRDLSYEIDESNYSEEFEDCDEKTRIEEGRRVTNPPLIDFRPPPHPRQPFPWPRKPHVVPVNPHSPSGTASSVASRRYSSKALWFSAICFTIVLRRIVN